MAGLTTLEEKLAEVLGLAQAAQGTTEKVEGMVEDEEIVATLKQMRDEAEEAERRCTEVADSRDGKKTAILEKAQETKTEATEMMSTYLGGEPDGLDGFEFLTMAEAGEVGHWAVLGKLNESAGERDLRAGRVGAADSGAAFHRRQGRLAEAGRRERPLRRVLVTES
jgi:hypothetical protein